MNTITQLDDTLAQGLLSAAARRRAETFREPILAASPDLINALADQFAVPSSVSPVLPGDLARQALQVLAQDEWELSSIESKVAELKSGRGRTHSIDAADIELASAVLVILRMHIRIERDKSDKWTLRMRALSKDNAALKTLIEMLMSYCSGGDVG